MIEKEVEREVKHEIPYATKKMNYLFCYSE